MAYVGMDERPLVSGQYHLSTPVEDITIKVKGENITLWGPDIRPFLKGPDWTCEGLDTWDLPVPREMLEELCDESGMDWDNGPYCEGIRGAVDELDDPKESIQDPEIAAALDQWRAGCDTMDDLHEPSYFVEWNQGEQHEAWVGGDWSSWKNGKIPQYTPEMLAQRDALNWMFNFHWNGPKSLWAVSENHPQWRDTVPDTTELLELVAVGENYGVAKCEYGAVFVPKGAINFLQHNGGATVGTIFDGEIAFTPGKKFLWRLTRDGVKFTYEDMCGTRGPDDY